MCTICRKNIPPLLFLPRSSSRGPAPPAQKLYILEQARPPPYTAVGSRYTQEVQKWTSTFLLRRYRSPSAMPFAESQLTVFALGTPGRESVRMAEESPQSTTACGTALACSSVLKALPPLTAYDREIADQTVSEIRLKENGKIRIIILINGQEIGKETAA